MKRHKEVEVYREDGTLVGRFKSLTEVAKKFNASLSTLSHIGNKPNPVGKINGVRYKIIIKDAAKDLKELDENRLFRPGETEDDVRKRLGLNPYGEWRTDEWIYAMMERVNKRLYPDGYDPRTTWQQQRQSERNKKKKQEGDIDRSNNDSSNEGYNNIDPEFNFFD